MARSERNRTKPRRIIMTPDESKAARLASAKKWREANREKHRTAVKKCRQAPRAMEAARLRSAIYASKNRERERARAEKWRRDNPDREKATRARYYRANTSKVKEATKHFRKNNPDLYRHYANEYKALKRTKGTRLPKGYRNDLLRNQSGLCRACKTDLATSGFEVDHIVAIARGGEHSIENVQLLCVTCNRRKATSDFEVFLKRLENESAKPAFHCSQPI